MDDFRRGRDSGANLPGLIGPSQRSEPDHALDFQPWLRDRVLAGAAVLLRLGVEQQRCAPTAARRLYGLSLGQAGAAYSAQVAGAFVGAVLVGQIRHRLGRRPTLALIGCGCGASLAAGALDTDITGLIAQRLALGLFMGAVFPVTVGILVDLFPPGPARPPRQRHRRYVLLRGDRAGVGGRDLDRDRLAISVLARGYIDDPDRARRAAAFLV